MFYIVKSWLEYQGTINMEYLKYLINTKKSGKDIQSNKNK